MRATAASEGSVSWATSDFRPTIDSDSVCGSLGMARNRRLPRNMAGSGSEDRLVAGIDLAPAAARAAVTDGRGRVTARAEAPLAPPQRPDPRTSEQDARSWWPAVAGALRDALAAVAAIDVAAVAVSATSGTVVQVDARGEPVGPALLYDDGRAPAPQRWDRLLAGPGA